MISYKINGCPFQLLTLKNEYRPQMSVLYKKVDTLCKYLQKILPHYNFIADFAWAGTFGQTKDGLPFIGEHPDFDNTYFVLGFGGNGITFSVVGMEIISALLKSKTHPLSEYYRFGR